MTFTKDSYLARFWLGLATNPDSGYTIDDVPPLSNLRDVVIEEYNKLSQ